MGLAMCDQVNWKILSWYVLALKTNNVIRTDGFGILIGLTLSGVLSIVGKLMSEAMCSNSIQVDDWSTVTSNHSSDMALGAENSEFQGSASGCIEFLDVGFLFGQATTEGYRPDWRISVNCMHEIIKQGLPWVGCGWLKLSCWVTVIGIPGS